jgi:hypothetical protein
MCTGALLSVIVVHNEARVNDSWYPAKQRQNDAEKETGNTTGHEHSQWRKNHAEKISQRFHHELFLFRFVLRFGYWTLGVGRWKLDVFLLFPRSVFCSS